MHMRRRHLMRCAAGIFAAGLVATALSGGAPAAPLDEQTCQQLKREVGDLEGIGARANLAKGPAWGKSNLSSAQLEQVKKLIEIEETVAFRCPRPKPVPEVQAGAVPAKAKAKQPPKGAPKAKAQAPVKDAATPAQSKAQAKPKANAGVNPAPKSAAKSAAGGAVGDGKAPAVKPKPKPAAAKVQDAYVPPQAKAAEPAR